MTARAATVLLCVLAASAAHAVTPSEDRYPVWPVPQEATYADDRLLLRDAVIVVPEGDRRVQLPGRVLAEQLADQFGVVIPVAVGAAPAGRIPLVVGDVSQPVVASAVSRAGAAVPEQDEGYLLAVDDAGAVLAGRDYRGALYAGASFLQLVHRWGHQSLAVRRATVRDWPALPLRFVHLYLPGRDQLGFARRYMRDFLLRNKWNGIVLEVGGGMRLDSHPEISVGWRRTVAEWYAHGETIDKLGEGIPLGTANRFRGLAPRGRGRRRLRREGRRAAPRLLGRGLWPRDRSGDPVAQPRLLPRGAAPGDRRGPGHGVARLLLPVEPGVVPHPVRGDGRVRRAAEAAPRPHRTRRVARRAFCARCRGKDTGELYAQDVQKIAAHLEARGIETWLWGDHFVDSHNRFAKRWSEGGVVRYEKPDTRAARDRLAASGVKLHVFNWSGESGDLTFQKLGWPFLVGNFAGSEQKDWPARVKRFGALGGEVSSWGAFEEFLLGKLQMPEAAYSINLLWSSRAVPHAEALAQTASLLTDARRLLASPPPPSATADPMRFEVLDIASAFNSAPRGEGWDLSGLAPGRGYQHGLPYAIGDPARGPSTVVIARRPGDKPTRAALPVSGRWASLVFLHAATAEGRPPVHAGDQTHFPRESSELLGYYEMRYADDLVAVHEIRYERTSRAGTSAPRSAPTSRGPSYRASCPTGATPCCGRASG
jgi:hypothetical protein